VRNKQRSDSPYRPPVRARWYPHTKRLRGGRQRLAELAVVLVGTTGGLMIVKGEWPSAFNIAAAVAGFLFGWLVLRLVGLASRRWREGKHPPGSGTTGQSQFPLGEK
jgi:hypothetical protein